MTAPPGCGSHAGLGAELRAVAVLALDRLGPVLERVRADAPSDGASSTAAPSDGAPSAAAPSDGGPSAAAPADDAPGRGSGPPAAGRGPQSADVCAVCPVCAVVAMLRGERPELGVRLAEHAAGLLAVLQAALHEGDPTAHRTPAPDGAAHTHPPHAAPSRRVQRIRVDRPAPSRPC